VLANILLLKPIPSTNTTVEDVRALILDILSLARRHKLVSQSYPLTLTVAKDSRDPSDAPKNPPMLMFTIMKQYALNEGWTDDEFNVEFPRLICVALYVSTYVPQVFDMTWTSP
jgi:hypothetical protein